MAPVYGCLYAGAGRLVVGRFGAAYFVELAVVDLHKLDYCSSFVSEKLPPLAMVEALSLPLPWIV